MATTLPPNVSYGKVVGRFLYADGDGTDGGTNPDGNAAVGTVTFTPNTPRLSNPTATPPVNIFPRAIVCTLDSDGFLRDPQNALGVWLIATDDPDLNPSSWTYRVTIALSGVKTPTSFDIAVPTNATVDLAVVAPVVASTGLTYVIGPPGTPGPAGTPGTSVPGAMRVLLHNGTSWPARTTVTTDPTHSVTYLSTAVSVAAPTDFVNGRDIWVRRG